MLSHHRIFILAATLALFVAPALAAALPIVSEVEWQPFVAQVRRLIEATDYLGAPFSAADKVALMK